MKGIITLCGSTRFKEEFLDAAKWLTLGGWIVLMPNVFGHKEIDETVKDLMEHQKDMLDKLHQEKIRMSDCVLIIDVDNYVGISTENEIEFAGLCGIPIHYLSSPEVIEMLNNG